MGFLTEGAAAQEVTPSFRPCKVTRLLGTLDDSDRALLISWLESEDSDGLIADKLRRHGVNIHFSTIRLHRVGRCCQGTGKVREVGWR